MVKPKNESTGTDLVIVTAEHIDDEMKRRGIALHKSRAARSRDLDETYTNGRQAGDRVSLNDGLSSTRASRRIS